MAGCTRLILALAVALVALAAPAVASAGSGPDRGPGGGLVVATDRGPVRGELAGATRQFLGIPYAAPPVGRLRWRPPQEPAAREGVLDATRFGSPCAQTVSPFSPGGGSENCLFLNVYTPPHVRPGGERAVMFWIHGGALVNGAGSFYGPAQRVGRGVVGVTTNYRLGALGRVTSYGAIRHLFLATPAPPPPEGGSAPRQVLRPHPFAPNTGLAAPPAFFIHCGRPAADGARRRVRSSSVHRRPDPRRPAASC